MTETGVPDRTDLFLPEGYRRNPQVSSDVVGGPYWQDPEEEKDDRYQEPVYKWAADVVRARQIRTVIDIGCGLGRKLVTHVAPVAPNVIGVDQDSAIEVARSKHPDHRFVAADLSDPSVWDDLAALDPDLAISADVIEHLEEPRELLRRLRALVGPDGLILLSTPDRSRMDRATALGPPTNRKHTREWSADELRLLLADEDLRVVEQRWFLPRAYSPTFAELRRFVGRARRRMALPDQRSCQAYLLAPR